jgi:hypothetical protein
MKRLLRRGAAAVIEESRAPVADAGALIEHPDGWYWVAPDGRQQFGPFNSAEDARADRDRYDEESLGAPETLHEAERDIGIADWIDPDTGEPPDGRSAPHIEGE